MLRESGSAGDEPSPKASGYGVSTILSLLNGGSAEESASSSVGKPNAPGSEAKERCRYAVVDIKGESGDKIRNLLVNNGYNDVLLVNSLAEHPDYVQPMLDENTEAKTTGHHDGDSHVYVEPCTPLFEPKSEKAIEMLHFGDFSAMDLLRAATSDCEEKKPSAIAKGLTDQIAPTTSFHKEKGMLEETLWELGDGVGAKERLKANRYVRCHLCKTVISAAQFTNLSNHARRHAAVKKYKCVWCEVQHNELAKIRAHLATAHCDIVSDPIDNSSPETRKEWDFMLQKCFPQCYSSFGTQSNGLTALIERLLDPDRTSARPTLEELAGPKAVMRKKCTACYRELSSREGWQFANAHARKVNTRCSSCRKHLCVSCFSKHTDCTY